MNKQRRELGHDIERLLAEVMPQADAHFQEDLERQLLTAYQQKKEGDKVKANGHLVTYADFVPRLGMKNNRQRRWSISLAATLLIALFVGLMLMSIEGKSQGEFAGASRITTATPTPNPTSITTVPVVVASQDLKGNQIIRFSDVKIQDYPADQVPNDVFSDVHEVIGAQLLTNILAGRPILEGSISSERVLIDFNTESPFGYLGDPAVVAYPRGSLTVNVRVSPETDSEVLGQMEQGTGYVVINRNEDWYQILYTASERGWVLQNFVFTRGETTSIWQISEPSLRPVVMNTQLVQRGTVITKEMLSIVYWPSELVSAEMVDTIDALVGQILVTDLRPYSPILREYLENGAGTEIDAGTVTVTVPMPYDAYFYGFQVGDTISITGSFLFIEPYEVNGVQVVPSPSLPEGVGSEPTDNMAFPQLVVQEIIPDAKIVNLGEMAVTEERDLQVMVLAVTSEQAEVLTWLIDSQIPLQYRIVIPVSGSH